MTHQKEEEEEKKVKIDDNTTIKVKTTHPSTVRPDYTCKSCAIAFPSQLDLEEHINIDHSKKLGSAA
jgi:hypothetical protein